MIVLAPRYGPGAAPPTRRSTYGTQRVEVSEIFQEIERIYQLRERSTVDPGGGRSIEDRSEFTAWSAIH
jgi:hypothetical protein